MNTKLIYKTYCATIDYDNEDKIYFGRIADIIDIISFHGETLEEVIVAFEEAVDDYLETCKKLGHEPNQSFALKISDDIRNAIEHAARLNNKTVQQWANEVLNNAAHV